MIRQQIQQLIQQQALVQKTVAQTSSIPRPTPSLVEIATPNIPKPIIPALPPFKLPLVGTIGRRRARVSRTRRRTAYRASITDALLGVRKALSTAEMNKMFTGLERRPIPISKPVKNLDETILKLAENMAKSMYVHQGIGLAAPQVGINIRVAIIDLQKNDPGFGLVEMINPEIIENAGKFEEHEEGCLSIPDFYSPVPREKYIKIKYINRKGEEKTIETDTFFSVVAQHEVDHLNGILFIDRISPLRKELFRNYRRKMRLKTG